MSSIFPEILAPPMMETKGRGLPKRLAEEPEFLFHEPARDGPRPRPADDLGGPHGGCVGAVRGPEGLAHEVIGQARRAPRQRRVVPRFARQEADVLEQSDLAFSQALDGLARSRTTPVRPREAEHGMPGRFGEPSGHRGQRRRRIGGPVGTSQVRNEEHARAGLAPGDRSVGSVASIRPGSVIDPPSSRGTL
jgi:hypothetical protein